MGQIGGERYRERGNDVINMHKIPRRAPVFINVDSQALTRPVEKDGDDAAFSYKIGAKYYINSMIPIQLDLTGASLKDKPENPLWLGVQGGYAIFVGDNVSIEPGLRYDFSLNDNFNDKGIFELRLGFALHF